MAERDGIAATNGIVDVLDGTRSALHNVTTSRHGTSMSVTYVSVYLFCGRNGSASELSKRPACGRNGADATLLLLLLLLMIMMMMSLYKISRPYLCVQDLLYQLLPKVHHECCAIEVGGKPRRTLVQHQRRVRCMCILIWMFMAR